MKLFAAIIILIHGLIHFVGFARAFQWADIPAINHSVSKSWSLLWLLAGISFSVLLVLYIRGWSYWWIIGLAAICFSQVLIIHEWNIAKWGTVPNIFILILAIIAMARTMPNSFPNIYHSEINKRMNEVIDNKVLTYEDVRHLPLPVQNYLQTTGVIGKPHVKNLKASFTGKMKNKINGSRRNIRSEQYNFFDVGERIFFIKSKWYGIPFEGLHLFCKGKTTMQIKIASWFKIADASGDKMNRSETVTFFNDMCLLAPATLISEKISWETIDPLKVKARFTLRDISISAMLSFNKEGELMDFNSDDRYLSEDGQTYQNLPWHTPVEQYRDVGGRKLIAAAQACWHSNNGNYCYASFITEEIKYNCTMQ